MISILKKKNEMGETLYQFESLVKPNPTIDNNKSKILVPKLHKSDTIKYDEWLDINFEDVNDIVHKCFYFCVKKSQENNMTCSFTNEEKIISKLSMLIYKTSNNKYKSTRYMY